MRKISGNTRRNWMLSALAGAAIAPALRSQQVCGGILPSAGFTGTIGRTVDDSRPAKLPEIRARAGAPNVVYIVLDDTGFSDLRCYGSEVSTPHIDALAAGGALFNNFHSKAICSPSRASLLTGRNSHAVGMKELAIEDQGYPHSRGRITPAAATVAQILGSSGYSTYGAGKWHLVPRGDMTASGSREHWPLQKGFHRWYGFLSGWTDQYRPSLVEDNHSIATPQQPGYHFSVDIVDHALRMMGDHVEADAKKPFFQYIAFGAMHAPLQVPKPYIEKYTGVFNAGWDRIREERHQRQLALGLIPQETKLPPRNPGDPAWDVLSDEERRVFARTMATYAGFLEHTDEQIGRVVAFLKEKGLFENTLIFLLSDNGGAPEAGIKGGFRRPYGDSTTVSAMAAALDELGGPSTQPLYQRPWAMVSDTPFRYYKLWPYRGGVQTPLIVTWPAGIRQHGLRTQFVDIIDITPTVLDIVGVAAPSSFQGVCQLPMHGASLRKVLEDPTAASPRDTQYFELWGSRAIYHRGWKAIGIHTPGTPFDDDRWELYDLEHDFSESHNLASDYPDRLEALKALWWVEAEKNGALPLLEAPQSRSRTYDQALEPGRK